MSLQVWLPLNGNLNNQGLSDVTVTNNGATVDSNGKIGSCYSFNTGKYLTVTRPVAITKEISYSCWVNISSWNNVAYDCILSLSTGANWRDSRATLCRNGSSTNLTWNIADGSSQYQVNSNTSLSLNTWYHIACTYGGAKLRIYINGVEDNSVSTSFVPNYDSAKLYIGSWHGDNYNLKGRLNDVRVYNHCLSAKEVKEISKGLVCHYKLDNNGFGNPNLCPLINKQEWTAVGTNAYYIALTSSTSNFGLSVGDTFTWSMYVKVPTKIKTLRARVQFYNSDSDRPNFYGTSITNGEGKVFVTGTVPSGYSRMELLIDYNSSPDITTTNVVCYYKMPKLEKGSAVTPWCPHTSDSLYTSLGLDSMTESDCSGYNNDGIREGNVLLSEPGGRYSTSTYCNSTNVETSTPVGAAFIRCRLVSPIKDATALTVNWWGNIESYSYQSSGILSLSNDSSYPTDYSTSALAQYDSKFMFTLIDGNHSSINSEVLVEIGNWHMYTLVFNNGTVQGYRDGMLIASRKESGILAQFTYVYLGINGAGGAIRKTKSKWSDFRIYATALSASDIKELYSTSASVDKNGNMYAYEFKEE